MSGDADDGTLERLARAPTPAGLVNVEAAVLGRIAGELPARGRDGFGLSAFAAAAAMSMGVLGGAVPREADSAQAALSPLTGVSSLAPSSLLMGRR